MSSITVARAARNAIGSARANVVRRSASSTATRAASHLGDALPFRPAAYSCSSSVRRSPRHSASMRDASAWSSPSSSSNRSTPLAMFFSSAAIRWRSGFVSLVLCAGKRFATLLQNRQGRVDLADLLLGGRLCGGRFLGRRLLCRSVLGCGGGFLRRYPCVSFVGGLSFRPANLAGEPHSYLCLKNTSSTAGPQFQELFHRPENAGGSGRPATYRNARDKAAQRRRRGRVSALGR